MIVGHGLVASAFISSVFDSDQYIVFASGISNSTESNDAAFIREIALLDQFLSKNKTLIYFSTTSIFDPTKKDTPYILHKLKIEHLIMAHVESYMIVRLPILIGHTNNPFTLINFLVTAIREKIKIQLHTRACRHLLDVDDLVPALTPFHSHSKRQVTINILGSKKISVPLLVTKLESILHTDGVFSWHDEGACYELPLGAGEIVQIDRLNYIDEILRKYIRV
ncbi:MAG: NAD-dependent epimerase/dehydratase family protein [Saprospiraceae bacterium]